MTTHAKRFIPRNYQSKMIDFILENPRCALFVGMGMGKTSACLSALLTLHDSMGYNVLILAPKRVANSTWVDETQKWDTFGHLNITSLAVPKVKREEALAKHPPIASINYENIEWLVETLGNDWYFDVIIADESTRLKSFRTRGGGKRAKVLAKVAMSAKIKHFINLTGTPSPNGLIDLWGQLFFLDKGQRLGKTYSAFLSQYFKAIQIGNNPAAVKYQPLPKAEAEIHAKIKDICLSLEAKDYFELGDTIVNNVYVTLPPKAHKAYKEMEDDLFTRLDAGDEVEAVNSAAKTMKLLQLASGAVYTDENGSYSVVHDEKLDALESVIEEANGMPVLVGYHFKSDLDRIQKRFPHARLLDSNPVTVKEWNEGKIPILLAHPASAGHGLNLQDGGNILVFFSNNWNLEEYQQICERLGATRQKQAGHDRPSFVYHIVAKDTLDEAVIARRQGKMTVQQALIEAMKRRFGGI